MIKKFIPLFLFIGISLLLWIGLSLDPRKIPNALSNKPIPKFQVPTIDLSNKTLSTRDFQGEYHLLNVWATWCLACKDEHSVLMKLAQRGVKIYGLDYKDNPKLAKQWLNELGNPYQKVGLDRQGKTAIDWGVYGTPETFLIDKNGIIRYKHVGALTIINWENDFMPIIKKMKTES